MNGNRVKRTSERETKRFRERDKESERVEEKEQEAHTREFFILSPHE